MRSVQSRDMLAESIERPSCAPVPRGPTPSPAPCKDVDPSGRAEPPPGWMRASVDGVRGYLLCCNGALFVRGFIYRDACHYRDLNIKT